MKKRIYGKSILCGEHSVLRGYPAISFPVEQFYLDIEYEISSSPLNIVLQGRFKQDLETDIKSFLDFALKKVGQGELRGKLTFTNELPFRAGLGGSATLCLAVSYIFASQNWIHENEIKDFALQLESRFHNKSSGIDIYTCFENKPILFQNGEVIKIISPVFRPLIYLSDSGLRSSTFKNVEQVQAEFKKNLELNQERDKKMAEATHLILEALESTNQEQGLKKISQAFSFASSCFSDWGLISDEFLNYTQKLKTKGALSVKPTGSGGGFALSLWNQKPPANDMQWIPLKI